MAERMRQGHCATGPGSCTRRRAWIWGYAYAARHHERPAYQWSVDVSVYVHPDQASARGLGRALYYGALPAARCCRVITTAYAGITLPNAGERRLCMSLSVSMPVGIYRNAGFKFGGVVGRGLVAEETTCIYGADGCAVVASLDTLKDESAGLRPAVSFRIEELAGRGDGGKNDPPAMDREWGSSRAAPQGGRSRSHARGARDS